MTFAVFRLSWDSRHCFVAWAGGVTRAQGRAATLEADPMVLAALQLPPGTEVFAEPWPWQPCTRIHASPACADDWEILEQNAGYIESQLLNQARVVWDGMTLPVWINSASVIRMTFRTFWPGRILCRPVSNNGPGLDRRVCPAVEPARRHDCVLVA